MGQMTPRIWHHSELIDAGLDALSRGGSDGAPLIEGRVLSVKATPAENTSSKMAVGVAVLPAGFATPPHHHEAEELATVLSGSGKMVIDGLEYAVERGSVVLVPSSLEHVTVAGNEEPLVVWWAYAPAGSENRWLEQGSADGG